VVAAYLEPRLPEGVNGVAPRHVEETVPG
jgi:hypothetical protein